jgi:hypothetical protein
MLCSWLNDFLTQIKNRKLIKKHFRQEGVVECSIVTLQTIFEQILKSQTEVVKIKTRSSSPLYYLWLQACQTLFKFNFIFFVTHNKVAAKRES